MWIHQDTSRYNVSIGYIADTSWIHANTCIPYSENHERSGALRLRLPEASEAAAGAAAEAWAPLDGLGLSWLPFLGAVGLPPVAFFFFLRKDWDLNRKHKKITPHHIKAWQSILAGEWPNCIKDFDEFRTACMSFHVVSDEDPDHPVPECEGNPCRFTCSCKGFKGVGICSHVLCINHKLKEYNVRYLLLPGLGKPDKKGKGGQGKRLPALEKHNVESGSSDDEELIELMKGFAGK